MPTLKSRINAYKEEFNEQTPEHIRMTMGQAIERLQKQNLSQKALKQGDHITPFTLLDAHNKTINIAELLNKNNFLVLSFYRGGWCPYCNLELQYLQKILPELKILNAQLLAISPQTPDYSLQTQQNNELQFEVLSDKNNTVARKFGLVYSLDDELRPVYESLGIDILQSNKSGSYDIPLPATYVVNKHFEIIYAFVDEDYTNRCEPQTIVHSIKEYIKNSH
jgi:peroxiredoxin